MVPFMKTLIPYFLYKECVAEKIFLCCLGPGMTNLVSRTVNGLIATHPTILARAEAVNALSWNFSSNILKGIKYNVFPIELLKIAGVSPFQNPFTPC